MILVAVGTQLPFDRMIRAVDEWAIAAGREDVLAQIGPSTWPAKRITCFPMISPDEFAKMQAEAQLIVAHAGMGSILGAIDSGVPIVVMPRRHALGEHRNDHQLATATHFRDVAGVHVADDEAALRGLLDRIDSLEAAPATGSPARGAFIANLRDYAASVEPPRWRRAAARLFGGSAR